MNRNSKKLIAVFLAIFMIFSSVGVYATEAAGTFSQQQELQFDWNIVNYEEFSMFEEAFEEFFLFETFEEMEEPAISENRRKYLELLESGYSNYQLRQRFAELFGDGYSGEYIFHNYRTIFDLKDGEIIDSAFLRVLSAYRVDLRFQDTGASIHRHAAGRASDDGRVRVFEGNEVTSVPEFDNMFLERILSDMLEPMVINDESFESVTTDAALRFDYMSEVGVQVEPLSVANSHVSINLVSVTNTSITVDLWFANNNSANNSVGIWEPRISQWRWLFGQGHPPGRSGRHTIPNLSPGVTYFLEALSWDGQRWHRQQIAVTTSAPPANIVLHQRSSVDFRLDRIFTDALGPDLTNRFMDAANEGFYVLHHFIGGSSPGRMRIDHVRHLPRYTEGWAGFPIHWQLLGIHNDWHLYSIDHAQRMRATNIETTEMPIHEIGHNFDNFRWSFEAEAMAAFFSYYYYATTGRRMANAGGSSSRTFQGGEFRTYMRNYAYRGLGQINHNEAMRRGVYSNYSMAYVLGTISGNIGWQPFTDTFNYFRALPHDEVPRTDLDKLNLFLTKLRDFSGRDVIAMIPANARNVYQQYFGGQIRYLARLTVSPSGTWQAPGEASSRTITVGSDTTWSVSSNQSWITISNIAPANQTGNGSFTINVASNAGEAFGRSGIVTVSGGGTTRFIHVTQPRITATLTIDPAGTWQVPREASSRTIHVTSNTTWHVGSNAPSWLTISNILPTNHTGNGSFRINASANTGSQRQGTITVSSGGIIRTILVIQAAVQDNPLDPPSAAITFPEYENQRIPLPLQNLTITWTGRAGARHRLALRDLSVGNDGIMIIPERDVSGTSFPVASNQLTVGHRYRVAVGTSVDNGVTWTWSVRHFYIVERQRQTVTITYVSNPPPGTSGITGSTPPSQVNVEVNTSVRLAGNSGNLQRTGHILLGWSRAGYLNNRNPQYTLGQPRVRFDEVGEVRLYAHWAPRGWQSIRNVDVFLYADSLFDTERHANEAAYWNELRNITNRAAFAFERTFGLRMNIQGNITRVDSLKTECAPNNESRNMIRPDFLCRDHNLSLTLPQGVSCCTAHHSAGRYMIGVTLRDRVPANVQNRGLHTMFFAGDLCFINDAGFHTSHYRGTVALGFAQLTTSNSVGRRSINSSTHDLSAHIVQHEWSHNFGVPDQASCQVACIMNNHWGDVAQNVENVWCYRCRGIIFENRTRI